MEYSYDFELYWGNGHRAYRVLSLQENISPQTQEALKQIAYDAWRDGRGGNKAAKK